MSSYYTTVSCDEWRRMQDLIKDADAYVIRNNAEIERLRKLEETRRAEFERIRQENSRAVERAVDVVTLIGRAAVGSIDNEIRQTVADASGELSEEVDAIRRSASQAEFRINQASDSIEHIAQQYNAIIEGIIAREEGEEARVNSLLAELDSMIGQIRNLHPEIFTPTDFAAIEENRSSIASNIGARDFQAALMLSQGSIIRAARVLTRLIFMNDQYDNIVSTARDRLSDIQRRIDELNSPEGRIEINLNGEELETEFDVDYWSEGAFGEIISEVTRITNAINSVDGNVLPIEELRRLNEEILQLRERIDTCDIEARLRLAGSLAVDNTAQIMFDNLTGRGFRLDDSGRQGDDRRNPYAMTYDDGTGNTVSIVISPGKNPNQPSFIFEAFSDNEGTARLVKEGVRSSLVSEGLNPQRTVHRDDCSENTDPETFISRTLEEVNTQNRRNILTNE